MNQQRQLQQANSGSMVVWHGRHSESGAEVVPTSTTAVNSCPQLAVTATRWKDNQAVRAKQQWCQQQLSATRVTETPTAKTGAQGNIK